MFTFKENRVFIEKEDSPTKKVVIVEEELDSIGNLQDLLRLIFIDKESGNVKVFVEGGDLTRNISQIKSGLLQAYRCLLRER